MTLRSRGDPGKRLPWAAGVGNRGRRLFVVPDLDLAVSRTAGSYHDPVIRQTMDGLFRRIVAAVRERSATWVI
jgi:hypothetical protein